MVVNDQSFRLEPFGHLTIPTTIGHFTYAVYADGFGPVQAPTRRYLPAGRDFPITIHP